MSLTSHHPRLPTFILGCLTAALLATPLAAQVQIDYTNGQTDATGYDTSAPNDPTTLSILSGTATQSGVLSGTGQVIKAGAGTLILSGLNTYTNDTFIRDGTLQVVAGASFSQLNASLFVADQSGDVARLLISGGTVGFGFGGGDFNYIGNQAGSSGTVDVTGGSWTYGSALRVGNDGTGVLNLSGGSGGSANGGAGAGQLLLGYNGGGSGTANVSGGTWVNGTLHVGYSGTGLLNISGGSLSNSYSYVGSQSGSSGTVNVSGGTWTSGGAFAVGNYGTGVLNLTGGTVDASGTYNFIGEKTGSSGTMNVSGGTWNTSTVYLGHGGTGVVNLTDTGIITVDSGNGTLNLGVSSGSSGTLNIGTGGAAGTLNAASIYGGSGTAVVNFNHTGSLNFTPTLDGSLSVNHIGPGTTTLTKANTYTGTTSVLGGTLELGFGTVTANIISSSSALTLGGGTLRLTGAGTQTLNGLTTLAGTASRIVLGSNSTLDLGALTSAGSGSSLNFNTAAGGADGDTVGSGVVLLSGQTAGSSINTAFTVTDSTGFGLATVNASNQIIRLTTSDLLPASGADSGTDYRIDNNSGGSTAAGSSSLIVTDSQTAHSITVDTTQAYGSLTLNSGVVLSTDVWNFGGHNGNPFEIISDGLGAGLQAATAGGMLQINNFNDSVLFISAPILDNGGSGLQVAGTGVIYLSGENTYTGDTLITGGALAVNTTGSISSNGRTTVGSQTGDNAALSIFGSMTNADAVLGDAAGASGSALVDQNASWYNNLDLTVGRSGTGVLNITAGYVESSHGHIGVNAGSRGTVTVSNSGAWAIYGDLDIGQRGTGVLNIADFGIVAVADGHGPVTLGAQGTLNIGMGGSLGLLIAETVSGVSGAVVNYNYNLFNPSLPYNPVLTGDLAVNKLGSGYLTFDQQNTYTGRTTVNGGTLDLDFTDVTTDIISRSSALTLGGGILNLYSPASGSSQTLNGLTTTAGTGSQIYLSPDVTLDLGALTSAGSGSALNFDLYEGGADGATVGTGIVLLSGQTAGSVINPGFTVTDSTGFGLATVNELNQIIRLTSTDLLPDSGAIAGTDYLIDNNSGGNLDPGSSSLEITASQTARSITVDSTQSTGVLTLDAGSVLSSDVWNFGGDYDYEITGSDSGAGITTATAGGMLQINNFNYDGIVTISAPILDNGGSGLRVAGPDSLTILTGTDTYTGETIINSGTLFINGDHTAATGEIIVQSSAELAGIGQIGSNIHVLNGGILTPGTINDLGTLTGTTATFDTNSIFHVLGGGDTLSTLHLSGAVTIASGALLYIDTYDSLTQRSYTLMTADGGGLDGSNPFTLGLYGLPDNYRLEYDGTTLKLVYTLPITAFWTGNVDSNWSTLSSGTSNWSTAVDGVTDTASLPGALTDVTFSATGVGSTQTNLDVDTTIYSLTIENDTGISTTGTQTLTVNNSTAVNALLAINSGVTLIGKGDLTVATTGTLAGSGAVEMALNRSILVNGAISVGDPTALPGAQVLSLTTSGTGAIVMGADSVILVNLYTGAGLGDNTGISTAADQLSLHGTLNATAGGTLVIGNHLVTPVFAGGDQWKVIDLNSGAGTITGQLAVNDSALGLATGFVGSFDQTTGIYSIADIRPELTAYSSGLAMANAEGQAIISGVQTALNDVNNHLFNLHSGGGEEEEESDGSISASLDYGVVVGQGDGSEDKNPIAKRIKRSRQWEVFTTVNYGNVKLNPISSQSGVQIDSWASSVGIERHLSRGLTLGFAATFLQSTQTYTGGLGKVDLEGPMLSAYVSYVHKSFWGSLLYSFGAFDLDSQRNPGLGLPSASGGTSAYTNAIQYNTGWNFRFQNNTLVTGPFVGIDYLHGSVDAYSETGGGLGALRYGRQTFESLVTRVGWSTSKKFDTDWATITPQFRLSYERQNLKNNGTSVSLINAPFTAAGGNQTPGQDYMVIGTGVNFQFTPDFSMLLGYQVQLFRNNMEAHFGSVRFGYKF